MFDGSNCVTEKFDASAFFSPSFFGIEGHIFASALFSAPSLNMKRNHSQVSIFIRVDQMRFHGIGLAFDMIFAGCMEVELLEVELDTIDYNAAPSSVIHLYRVTIVQDFVASCLDEILIGLSSASMRPVKLIGDWFLPLQAPNSGDSLAQFYGPRSPE